MGEETSILIEQVEGDMFKIKKAPKMRKAKPKAKRQKYLNVQKRQRFTNDMTQVLKAAGLDTRNAKAEANRIATKYKQLFVEWA